MESMFKNIPTFAGLALCCLLLVSCGPQADESEAAKRKADRAARKARAKAAAEERRQAKIAEEKAQPEIPCSVLTYWTKRSNSVEIYRSGDNWRMNTYWYSIVPNGEVVTMFNDSNKRYLEFTDPFRSGGRRQFGERRRGRRRHHGVGSMRHGMIPGFFSGPKPRFMWSEWQKVGLEKLHGIDAVHYKRVANSPSYVPPVDDTTDMLKELAPTQSTMRGDAQRELQEIRNVTATEHLWVVDEGVPPELCKTVGFLFGSDPEMGLAVQNSATMIGIKNGKKDFSKMTFFKITGGKDSKVPANTFKPPEGYTRVKDTFSVMVDDAGAEELLYMGN